MAANAIRHTLRALDEDATCLDGLTYALFALAEDWPATAARVHLPGPSQMTPGGVSRALGTIHMRGSPNGASIAADLKGGMA